MLQRNLIFIKSWCDFFVSTEDMKLSICGGAIAWMLNIPRKHLPEKIRVEFYPEYQQGTVKVSLVQNGEADYWAIRKGWLRRKEFLAVSPQINRVRNLMGMEWGHPFYLKVIDLDKESKFDKAREVCMLGA